MRIRVLLLPCAVALAAAGCAVNDALLRQAREQENRGLAVRGETSAAVVAAEGILRGMGYRTSSAPLYRGPGRAGKEVLGVREVERGEKHESVPIGTRKGVLNVRTGQTVRIYSGEIVRVQISGMWDGSYKAAAPGMLILRVIGESCDKDSGGRYVNCKPLDGFDARFVGDRVMRQTQAVAGAMATKENLAAQPASPPQASQDADYQAALALYTAGDVDGAWRGAYAIAQADPKYWQAWQLIGNCQVAKGDRPGALASYRTALQLHPDNQTLRDYVAQLEAQP